MLLQPTSPLRITADIDGAVQLIVERRGPALASVCEAPSHPYLARRIMEDGTLVDFLPTAEKPERRQDFPPAYCMNGAIYIATRDAVLEQRTFDPPGMLAYPMPVERSLDIDTLADFHQADLILRARAAATSGAATKSL
jgi:CMP-N-acetylneuraminic acid synthetase